MYYFLGIKKKDVPVFNTFYHISLAHWDDELS